MNFAFKYAKLPNSEREIIEMFYISGSDIGGYSEITRRLGRKTTIVENGKTVYGEEPNVRKTCLTLIHRGILKPCGGKNKYRLADNWIDIIINS